MKTWHKWAFGLLVLAAVGAMLPPRERPPAPAATVKPDVGDPFAAQLMARKFVAKRLKSPATAAFSGEKSEPAGDAWVVTGLVDSQNTFGALLRMAYVCKVRHTTGDTWELEHPCTFTE